MHAISSYRGNRPTNTHKQTEPITIHCATKLSTQIVINGHGMCSVFWLFSLSLLAKRLARKTPLRKPNRGAGIISIKPRLKRACDCVGLLYSFVVLLHDICVLPGPTRYISYFYGMI